MNVLHSEISGDGGGPPLLLGGSLGSSLTMWDPQVAALSGPLRVVRFDHRGHGRSALPTGPHTVDGMGRDVLRLLDALGLERVSYCGLSIGGMVGMWLAANAPDRIDRLVLICTSAHLPPAEAWRLRAATVRATGSVATVADGVVARWLTPAFAAREPAVVDGLKEMLVATSPEGYAACCEAIADLDLRADLPRITAPTLVVAGTEDAATPPAHAETIARAIPSARLQLLSPMAHLGNVEQPSAVTKLILDHVQAQEPPR